MKIKKRNQGNYLKRRLGKILLLVMVVLIFFGSIAFDLLAHPADGSLLQAIDSHGDGSRIGILMVSLLLTLGLLGLFSSGGGDREPTESGFDEVYKILFEGSPTANVIIGSDGTIKDLNRSAMAAFGCSKKSQLVGRPASEFVAAEHRSRLTQLLEDSQEEKVREIEMDVPVREEQTRSFLFSSSRVVPSDEVKHTDILLVGIDITDRRKAERALEGERQRLFSVLDVIPAFIYLQAPDYTVPFVNRKFRELFGDPKGRPCYEAFYGRGEPCDPCITLRVLQTRSPQTWEWTSREDRTYLIYEDLFPGTEGKEMVMEIGIDITERKQAEEALRIGRERYALATGAAKVGVWDWNLNSGEFYLDPNIKATLGYADWEIPNDLDAWLTHVHPEDREPVMEAAQAHLDGRTVEYAFEHRMQHKDGTDRWIMVRGKAIRDAQGKVIRMVGTDTDITQRKQEEKENARCAYELKFLSETALRFSELSPEEDIYRFIGERLKQLVPHAAYVAVNSFDQEERSLQVRCILGSDKLIDAATKIIGRNPTGMSFAVNEEAWQGLTSDSLVKVPGGLHELTFGQIPQLACKALEKLAGIGDIYVMGFTKRGGLYGGATLILQRDVKLGNQDAIQAFMQQAGVALQRRQAEEALQTEREKLERVTQDVGVGLAIVSKDYRILWSNRVLKQIFGEGEDKSCRFASGPQLCIDLGRGVREILQTGKDQVVHEQMGRDKHGKTIWSQIIATPIKDSQGNVTGALEVVVPITEQKQNEQLQSVLHRIIEATNTSKDTDELFRTIQTELGTILDTANFFVALHDKETDITSLVYHVDEKDQFTSFPPGKTLTSWILKNDRPLLCTQEVRKRLLQAGEIEPIGIASKAWLGVPLKTGSETIGVVGVQSYKDSSAYGVRELEVLQFASGQIATAIQRKQAQEALKRSESYYRGIFEGAHDAIIIFEPEEETILDLNQRACEIYGFERSEFVGSSLKRISKDATRGKKHIELTLDKGTYHRFETVQYRKDGSEMFLEINASVVDYQGRQAILSINRDITERKQTEKELRSSEQRYRLLFERNLAAVYQTTPDGRVIDCNQSFARLLGYESPRDMLNHNASEFYSDSLDRERFLSRLKEQGSLTGSESWLRRKDGQPIWISENVNLIQGDENTPALIQGTAIDITQRKQAEDALRRSEERYRSLFQDSPISLWEEDFSEVKKHLDKLKAGGITDFRKHFPEHPQEVIRCAAMTRVTDVNKAAVNFYRAKDTEQLKSALDSMLAKDAYRPFTEELICIGQGRTFFETEAVTYTLTGEERHVIMRWTVLPGYEETLSRVVLAMTDVTEIKQAAEKLRESEEKLRNIFESVNDFMILLDARGNIQYVNRKALDAVGKKKEEIVGKNLRKLDIFSFRELPQVVSAFFKALVGGPRILKTYVDGKDGQRIPLECSASFIRKGGKIDSVIVVARDIAEREQAREELERERERYRNLFEMAPDSITILDAKGFITSCNVVTERLAGCPKRELIGKHFSKLGVIRIKDIPKYLKLFGTIIRGKLPQPVELEVLHKDGSTYHVEAHVSLLKEKGRITGVQVITRDVTQRKKMEEMIKESEQKYRELVETSIDMIFKLDPEGNFLFTNRSWRDRLGYSEEETKNINGFKLICPEDLPAIREQFNRVLSGKVVENVEFKSKTKDGSIIHIMINGSPVFDPRGNVIAILGAARDVTELKQAEEALQKSEEKFRTIVETAPSLLIIANPDGTNSYVSPNCKEITGYSQEELLGKMIWWVHEDDAPRAKEVFHHAIQKGLKGRDFEYRAVRKSGEIWHASSSWESLLDDEGKLRGVILQTIDITDRKQAEEALHESEERYRQLFENMRSGASVYQAKDQGEDFAFRDFNRAGERIEGVERKNLIGKTITQVFPRVEDFTLLEAFRKVWKTGIPQEGIRTTVTREGRTVAWRENRVFRLPTGEIVSIFDDVTQRIQAEEALKQSENKFRTLVENIIDWVWQVDENGTFTYVSPQAEKLMGYPVSEMLGKTPFDFIASQEAERIGAIFSQAAARRERIERLEGMLISKDGREVTFEANATPLLDERGKLTGYMGTCRDATDRKRAEEALRKSEEKHRTYIENAPDGIFICDSDARYVDVNQAACRMTGYSREQLLNMRIIDLAPPDKPPERSRSFEELKRTGKVHSEIVIQKRDGAVIHASLDAVALSDGRYMAFCSDITERKRAEEELRENQAKLQSIVSAAPAGIGMTIDRTVRELNTRLCEMTGYSKEDLHGRGISVVYPSDEDYHSTRREIYRQLAEKGSSTTETCWRRKDGRLIHVLLNCAPLKPGDLSQGITFAVLDITERKQSEEALRESEERIRTLADASFEAIVIHEEGVLRQANDQFFRMFGYTAAELLGKKVIPLLIAPESIDLVKSKFTSDSTDTYEIMALKKDGTTFPMEIHSKPMEYHGRTVRVASMRDLSLRKKMEIQLIQAERLAAVGTLAYGIAHEFNNIIAGILGNAEFGMGNDNLQEVEECFRVITENCERARSITNHLLAFARRREAKKEMAEVSETVDNVLGLIERELEKENMRVERKFDPVPQIFCDPGELAETFLNMITNARDAMRPEGGTLTIGIRQKGDDLLITFTDTGCGIPDGIKQRIFEPFVTTKGALGQSEIPGTGLGLFLSYGIISRYKGDIKVESQVGKGSTFTISIPISGNQMAPDQAETESSEPTPLPRNLRILLVDDEESICKAMGNILKADGYSVVSTTSGKEGLDLFKDGSFDLVLSDITMPDMDGVKLMCAIKNMRPLVKLIALTGHVKDERLTDALNAGADQILAKPFKKEDLYRAMSKVFS